MDQQNYWLYQPHRFADWVRERTVSGCLRLLYYGLQMLNASIQCLALTVESQAATNQLQREELQAEMVPLELRLRLLEDTSVAQLKRTVQVLEARIAIMERENGNRERRHMNHYREFQQKDRSLGADIHTLTEQVTSVRSFSDRAHRHDHRRIHERLDELLLRLDMDDSTVAMSEAFEEHVVSQEH
jgi:hypothetical protein